MKKILIAEDEYILAKVFERIIIKYGHEVIAVTHNKDETIKMALQLKPDIIFLDISMDYASSGIDACKAIKEKHPEIKVYFLTAYSKDAYEKELADINYEGYIDKFQFKDVVTDLLKE